MSGPATGKSLQVESQIFIVESSWHVSTVDKAIVCLLETTKSQDRKDLGPSEEDQLQKEFSLWMFFLAILQNDL